MTQETDCSVLSHEEGTKNWYALKVFFNRMPELDASLRGMGIETFIPRSAKVIMRNGKRIKTLRPIVNSLLMMHPTREQLSQARQAITGRGVFYTMGGDDRQPAIISDREMNIFRLLTDLEPSTTTPEYLGQDTAKYEVGDHVRVTAGPLAGAEGHICRIRGNRRLVVTISGICAIATSYVPRCFLEKI